MSEEPIEGEVISSSIISLGSPRAERETQFREDEVFCLECHHRWRARAPKDVDFLECPNCGLMRGKWYLPFIQTHSPHWVCDCGNNLFLLSAGGIYCPNCGKDQDYRPHN